MYYYETKITNKIMNVIDTKVADYHNMEHQINGNESEAAICSTNETTSQYHDSVTVNNTSIETKKYSNE